MNWLILTLISVLFRSVYGVMTKVMSNKFNAISVYGQAVALPFAAVIISITISPFIGGFSAESNLSLAAIILTALGQGLGNIAYFVAIKDLQNSTAQVAFSSILIFNTVLAVLFLGLDLSLINIIGIFVLMLAILMVVSGKIQIHKKGFAWMLLSALLFSIFQLASSELSKQVSAPAYLVIAYGGAAITATLLKFKEVKKDFKVIIKSNELKLVPFQTAALSLGNFLFAYYAYRSAPEPSKVAILLTSQIVLTVLLSYFFLKEKSHLALKVLASILVIIAAYLIKL